MEYTPRIYQTYCTEKILNLPEIGLFLDMGLGKTVITLTALVELLKRKAVKKTLVIAPKKVAESVWDDEIEQWDHLNHLITSKVLGPERKRKEALSKKADLYIINRENIVWLVSQYGTNWPFDFVIIDELSSFKSEASMRFKAIRQVRPYIKKVVGLTGTPAPNGLLDLWSQMYILDKGKRLYDSYTQFREKYFEPNKKDGYRTLNYKLKSADPILLGKNFYEKEIYNRISDICFSMKTEDYIDLPKRIDINRYIKFDDELQQKYEAFEQEKVLEFIDKTDAITAVNAAALTSKLLQFSNGMVYDEFKKAHTIHSEKLDILAEEVEELNGDPLIVFYSFVSDKERILRKFKFAREIKDKTSIKDWNNRKIPLMVAHPGSAGHGLNLQFGGEHILWYQRPWSLELYNQGLKRIHRSGVKSVVTNKSLIVKNTMDESVVKALTMKHKSQEALIHAVKARIDKWAKGRY